MGRPHASGCGARTPAHPGRTGRHHSSDLIGGSLRYLFESDGLAALRVLPQGALYAFDFDGTLSRIVDFPMHARTTKRLQELLTRLARQAPTAIMSGRALSDVAARIQVPGAILVGNHGAEGVELARHEVAAAHATCAMWHSQLQSLLATSILANGGEIEDKSFTLSIHYRRTNNYAVARATLDRALALLTPSPRVVHGKAVCNLIPTQLPNKGTTLLTLLRRHQHQAALYVGDDDTDEDVFGLEDARIISVRVGFDSISKARFFLRKQSEVERLVRTLLLGNSCSSRSKGPT